MTIYESTTYRIRQLFSTLAVATASNPVLLEGEKWLEKDATTLRATGRSKTGDGVLSADKTTIIGTAFNALPFDPGGSGGSATDLSVTARTETGFTIASSTGEDAPIPVATASLAGLESAADKAKLDSIVVDSAKIVRIPIRNNSGVSIPKGAPCYQTGSSGTIITVALADASSEATASQTLGIAETAIPDNSFGNLIELGILDGLNTSALTEGQIIWLSEVAGTLTSTRPTQPAHGVICGYCIKQGSGTSGIIYVKVSNGLELYELHDVLIVGPSTGTQVLRRGSDGLWRNATLGAGDVGADPAGTASAAVAAGLAGKADLVGGLVPTSQIPAIALVQYLGSVANQSAMLALRGQGGDWCIRTDTATEWVIVANDGASLSDWIQLPTGIAPVSSINGQTGSVTLGTGDLSETGSNLFFTATRAIGAALTGFTAAAGTVAATDSILAAFQKLVGNVAQRAIAGAIGSSGLTMAPARLLGRSTAGVGAPEEFALLGLAFNGSNLATLADPVIPLSGETTALTASSTVAKVTIPYWPHATVITDPWIWAVAVAPAGATPMQFDIQVNGTSIYLPASGGTYPTIAAGSTNSTASAGAFTTAFAAAPTIPTGSSVAFFVRQVGSTVAGAGLKVTVPTRRAG